jgi:hypothetical protein
MAKNVRSKVRMTSVKPEKSYKNSIKVVNLSGYQSPEIVEQYNKDWVLYLAGDDGQDYFDGLIEKYLGSPTNARCINGISDMIYGRGLEATDSREKPEMYAKMKLLLHSSCMRKLVNDYKLLGQGALQIVYNKQKTAITKVMHFPMETLRAEKAKDGKIKAYYYHPKWSEIKPSDNPKRIPTFGNGGKSEPIELYIFKPYKPGFYYYAPVDYNGCLQYAELEEEVANYHINNIQNGLQPSLLVNFNNGVPNEETQELIERKIYDKFSGSSNAGKFILTFNESSEDQATIEPIHLPDAHAQYQFLADESREKIMLGHGIVSPILLGIKDNTGFGNNAEELRTASILMDNIVIRPFQQAIIDGLNDILSFNGIFLNLYFVTLQPIEFTELENISTKVKREEETGEKLSSQEPEELEDLADEELADMFDRLEDLGEVVSDDWELVSAERVDLAVSEDDAKAEKRSRQDNKGYKVRYAYMPMRKSPNSRFFCKNMEALTERDIVFRKEDITNMSRSGVNAELGHNQRPYNLFKYKGGKNCHHYWEKRVYKKKQRVSEDEALAEGYLAPNNPSEVQTRPVDMPNGGAYPTK